MYAIEASGRDADEQWISAYLVMPQGTDASGYWQAVCDSSLVSRGRDAFVSSGRDALMSMDMYALT